MSLSISNMKLHGPLAIESADRWSVAWLTPDEGALGLFQKDGYVNITFTASVINYPFYLHTPIDMFVSSGTIDPGLTFTNTFIVSRINVLNGQWTTIEIPVANLLPTDRILLANTTLTGYVSVDQGLYNFTLTARLSGKTARRKYIMAVGDVPNPIWITPPGIIDFNDINVAVPPIVFKATDPAGFPLTYNLTQGSLPSGVFLRATTGKLVGTYPNLTEDQEFNFTITVSNGQHVTPRSFSIWLNAAPPANAAVWVTPSGSIGSNYELTPISAHVLAVSPDDSPLTYVPIGGTFPSGTSVDANTGVFSGTLDEQPDNTEFKFIIGAKIGNYSRKRLFTFKVKHDPAPFFANGSTTAIVMPSIIELNPYDQKTVQAFSNPDLPLTLTANGLLSEFTLNSETGNVVSNAATYIPSRSTSSRLVPFILVADDGIKTATQKMEFSILQDYPPEFIDPDLGATFGLYQVTYPASGNLASDVYNRPITYTLNTDAPQPENTISFPSGLSFDTSSGVVSGFLPDTSMEEGDVTISFSVTAQSGYIDPISTLPGAQAVTQQFTITAWKNVEPIWDTPAGHIGNAIEFVDVSFTVSAHDPHEAQTVYYELTSSYPPIPGFNLDNNIIQGASTDIGNVASVDYTFTFEASYRDGLGNKIFPISRTFMVTVNKNYAPVWEAGSDLGGVLAGQPFSMPLPAYDPNGLAIQYITNTTAAPALNTVGLPNPSETHLIIADGSISGRFEDNMSNNAIDYSFTIDAFDGIFTTSKQFLISSLVNTPPRWLYVGNTSVEAIANLETGEIFDYNSLVIDGYEETLVHYQFPTNVANTSLTNPGVNDDQNQVVTFYTSIQNQQPLIDIGRGQYTISLSPDGTIAGRLPPAEVDTIYVFYITAWDQTRQFLFTRYYPTGAYVAIRSRFNRPPYWISGSSIKFLEDTDVAFKLFAQNLNQYVWVNTPPRVPPVISTSSVSLDYYNTPIQLTNDAVNAAPEQLWYANQVFGDVNSANAISDFIPTSYGEGYEAKLYIGDPSSGGDYAEIFKDTIDEEFAYDYSSGILVFLNSPPSEKISQNNNVISIATSGLFMRAYRYTGKVGVNNSKHEITYSLVNDPSTTGLPANMVMSSDGVVSGRTPIANTNTIYTFTVQANNGLKSANKTFAMTVYHNLPPVWVAPFTRTHVANVAFSDVFSAVDPNGFLSPAIDIVVSNAGNLPGYLSFSNSAVIHGNGNGRISGKFPFTDYDEDFTFELSANDGRNPPVTQSFTITHLKNQSPVFNIANSTNFGLFVEQDFFTRTISATDAEGNAIVYTTDQLPGSLVLANNTLSGVLPASAAQDHYDFSIVASDGTYSTILNLSLDVQHNYLPIWVTDSGSLGIVQGGFTLNNDPNHSGTNNYSVVATDQNNLSVITAGSDQSPPNHLVYSISNGALPEGLALSSSGLFSGVYTNPIANATYSFEVTASDGVNDIPRQFTIDGVTNPLVWVTNAGLIATVEGGYEISTDPNYSTTNISDIVAEYQNNDPTKTLPLIQYTISGGSLPEGVKKVTDRNSGALTGKYTNPIQDTQYTFEMTATDGVHTISREFIVNGLVNLGPVFDPPSRNLGTVNEQSRYTFTTRVYSPDGVPVTVSGVTVYDGFTYFAIDGGSAGQTITITGTLPATNMNNAITLASISAFNEVLHSSATYTLNVAYVYPPVFQTSSLPVGIDQTVYIANIVATSSYPVFYSISDGVLPSGLQLDGNTGVISGIAPFETDIHDYPFTVTASIGIKSADQVFTIRIVPNLPPIWDTSSSIEVLENTPNASLILRAHDVHSLPIQYTLENGAIPSNWIFNANTANNTCTINGDSPIVANDSVYTFTIGASNGYIRTDREFTLTIKYNNSPVWTTNAGLLANAYAGTVYTKTLVATDRENQTVTYLQNAVSNAWPSWATLDANTGIVTGTLPPVFANTSLYLSVDASDGQRSTPRTFYINDMFDSSYVDPFSNAVGLHINFDSSTADLVGGHTISGTLPTIDPTTKAYGTASGKFISANGTYLSLPANTDTTINPTGSAPLTIEFMVRPTSLSNSGTLFSVFQDTSVPASNGLNTLGYMVRQVGNKINFYRYLSGNPAISIDYTMSTASAFYHVALVSNGNQGLKCFVNGTYLGDLTAFFFPYFAAPIYIGSGFDGWIDDIRITNAARYSTNFTPKYMPVAPVWVSPANGTVIANAIVGVPFTAQTQFLANAIDSHAVAGYMKYNVIGNNLTNSVSDTGLLTGTVSAYSPNYTINVFATDTNGNNTKTKTFGINIISYAVSPNVSTVSEGNSVVYTVITTNVSDGSVLYWTNDGTTSAADFAVDRGSLSFTSGKYLTIPNSSLFTFGTGDFTVEAWVYIDPAISTNIFAIFNVGGTTVGSYSLYWIGTSQKFQSARYGDAGGLTTNTYAPGQWYHVANVRSGGTSKLYINGVADTGSTFAMSSVTASTTVNLGNAWGTTGATNVGCISNLRVVKGSAVYTSNFTPPTNPLTAISNTALLLNAANSGSMLLDSSSNNFTLTNIGGVSWSSSSYPPITFGAATNSGSLVVTANTSTITRTLSADGVVEGNETIALKIRTGSTSGTVVATANTVTVTNTL